MTLEAEIEAIRDGLNAGQFSNEASVSQGIVLRLLHALGWPAYNTQVVWPEYSLSGRRVDYALCHPAGKPIAFVEVKQVGRSDGAERQLFEYAFHVGVPLAILTDGREWNFFLPGEQGDYGERRVYKLDLIERDANESASRLRRYLLHQNCTSGSAIEAARSDYRSVAKERQILSALPEAWQKLVHEEDELLLEIVADRVESICGFKPSPDAVAAFLKRYANHAEAPPPGQTAKPHIALETPVPPLTTSVDGYVGNSIGYVMNGKFHAAKSAREVLIEVFEALTLRDRTFPERFAAVPQGRTRRYLANDRDLLYPGRPDLCSEFSIRLKSGWWLGTNHSRQTIYVILEKACKVAGLRMGTELKVQLG